MYTCIHVFIDKHGHKYIDIHRHACMHACIPTYLHMQWDTYIWYTISASIYVYIYIYISVCVHVCVCVSMYCTVCRWPGGVRTRFPPWPFLAQDAILKAAGSGIYEMRWNDAELTMGGKASAGVDHRWITGGSQVDHRWIIGQTAGISVFSLRHVQFFSHCWEQNKSKFSINCTEQKPHAMRIEFTAGGKKGIHTIRLWDDHLFSKNRPMDPGKDRGLWFSMFLMMLYHKVVLPQPPVISDQWTSSIKLPHIQQWLVYPLVI